MFLLTSDLERRVGGDRESQVVPDSAGGEGSATFDPPRRVPYERTQPLGNRPMNLLKLSKHIATAQLCEYK